MKNPKEKAEDLISKMCLNDFTNENINYVKQYALIAVDELILISNLFEKYYWDEVKIEINKI